MIPFRSFILPKIHASISRGPLTESVEDIHKALYGGIEQMHPSKDEEIPYLKQHHTPITKEQLYPDGERSHHDVLRDLSTSLYDHYPFEEHHKNILARYTGTHFSDGHNDVDHAFRFINARILRLGKNEPIPSDEHDMATMDSALHAHKTPHELTTYSGLSENHGHLVATNDRVHHPAYLSTSLSASMATSFANHTSHGRDMSSHILKVHIPAGHPGAYVEHITRNRGEREFILPRDTTLRIDHSKREILTTSMASWGRKGNMHTIIHHAYPETK